MVMRWLASYPRSGNTWVRTLLANYMGGPIAHWSLMNAGVVDLNYFQHISVERGVPLETLVDDMLEARQRARGRTENDSDPLILKTHDRFSDEHPFARQTDRAVYLIRNPRDVLISHLNYRRLTYRDEVDSFQSDRDYAMEYIRRGGDPPLVAGPYGSWEQNVRSWTTPQAADLLSAPRALVVQYEALRRDPETHLRGILEFFDYPVDAQRLLTAVAASSREQMRRLETEARQTDTFFRAREGVWFVGEGRVNQSLAMLGEDVEQRFLDVFGAAMAEFGYDPALTSAST